MKKKPLIPPLFLKPDPLTRGRYIIWGTYFFFVFLAIVAAIYSKIYVY